MQPRRLLFAASLVLFSGCGDKDPTGLGGSASGTVTFNYTGGGGGTFNVSGVMPTISANVGNSDAAAGFRDNANSGVSVFGARTRGGGRFDAFSLFVQRLTVGSRTVDVANCDPEAETCETAVLMIDFSNADEEWDFLCFLETGSMAITEISNTRAKGSFSGSGTCLSFGGNFSSFTVTGGSFDVPLLSQLPQ